MEAFIFKVFYVSLNENVQNFNRGAICINVPAVQFGYY